MIRFTTVTHMNRKFPAHDTRRYIKLLDTETNEFCVCDNMYHINSSENRSHFEEIIFLRRVIKFYFDYYDNDLTSLIRDLNIYFQNYFLKHYEILHKTIPEIIENHFYIRDYILYKRILLKNLFYMSSFYEVEKFVQNFKKYFPQHNIHIRNHNLPLSLDINNYNFDDFVHYIPPHLNPTNCIVFLDVL